MTNIQALQYCVEIFNENAESRSCYDKYDNPHWIDAIEEEGGGIKLSTESGEGAFSKKTEPYSANKSDFIIRILGSGDTIKFTPSDENLWMTCKSSDGESLEVKLSKRDIVWLINQLEKRV